LLVIGAAAYVGTHSAEVATHVARRGLRGALSELSIPKEQEKIVLAQADSLLADVRSGKLGWRQLAATLREVQNDAALRLGPKVVRFRDEVLPSVRWSAEERAEAVKLCQRILRGLVDRTIERPEIDELSSGLDSLLARGKETTSEETRRLLARARAMADRAGVPKEPVKVDIPDLVRSALRRARELVSRDR
jgi:hypothetical protein